MGIRRKDRPLEHVAFCSQHSRGKVLLIFATVDIAMCGGERVMGFLHVS